VSNRQSAKLGAKIIEEGWEAGMNSMECALGQLEERITHAIQEAERVDLAKRIWRKDPTLWKDDESSQKIIRNSLGWLTVPDEMIGVVDELTEFAQLIRNRGFKTVMVCGMGGSSLCPEVLARTFGRQPDFPELLVLDSTDPDVLADFLNRIELERCLFIIASKSGSTTEPNTFYKFWYDQLSKRVDSPGTNFIAITDPGSPLVETAADLGFQRTFLNQPDIGGRYSALSYFGMVPAALMGIDIRKFLAHAKEAEQTCSPVMPAAKNEALQLGTVIGESANAGRNKLTLLIDEKIERLGLWIEQLVAESTGKEGKGILPVASEPLGAKSEYGDDRLFVSISIGEPSEESRSRSNELIAAGHQVVYRKLSDVYDLGAEFFIWEFATACAGWRLGINPFDQPNVQESKDATKELLNTFVNHGRLPEQDELVSDDSISIYAESNRELLADSSTLEAIRSHLSTIKKGDYVALLCYVEETPAVNAELQEIRSTLRRATKCATTTGYGPRFLHSTGQLHKGGPDTGVFFQITANDAIDFAVPGEAYTFSVLKQAQALGDFRSLSARGRRAIRVDHGNDTVGGLRRLRELISRAVAAEPGAASAS
jgi:transaldolase/glucose-6-phosphate isomerase